MKPFSLLLVFVFVFLPLSALSLSCGGAGGADGDTGTDGDVDAETEGDGTVDGDLDTETDGAPDIDADPDNEPDAEPDPEVIIPEECRSILQKVSGSDNCIDGKCSYALLEPNEEFTTSLVLSLNRSDDGQNWYSAEELEARKGCLMSYLESAGCTEVRDYLSRILIWARCGNWLLDEIVQMPVIGTTTLECMKGEWCSCLQYTKDTCFQNPFCKLVEGRELNKDLDCWEDLALDVCRTDTYFLVDIDECYRDSYCVRDANGACYSVSGCDYNSAYVDWNIDPWCCAGWRDNCRNLTDGDVDPYTAEQCGDVQPLYVVDLDGVDLFNFKSECHHIRHRYEEPYLTETCTVVSVGTTFPGAVFYCLPIDSESLDKTVYSWPGPWLGCGIGTTSISRVPGWHAINQDSGFDVDGCVDAVNSGNFPWFMIRQKLTPTCEDSEDYLDCLTNIDLPYYCQAQIAWPVMYRDGACLIPDPLTDPDFSLDDGVYVGCMSVLPFSHAMPVPPKYTGLIRNRETGQCLGVIEPFAFVEGAMPRGWEPADCIDCLPGNSGDGDRL